MREHLPNAIHLSLLRLERHLLKDLMELKSLRSMSISLYIPSFSSSLNIEKREEERFLECRNLIAEFMADSRLRKLEVYAGEPSLRSLVQSMPLWHSSKKQPILRMSFSIESGQLERIDS